MKNLFSRIEKDPVDDAISKDSPFTNVRYESILQQMVQDGDLPPSERVLKAIREKKVGIDEAKAKWKLFKNEQKEIVGDDKGTLNKPEDLRDRLDKDLAPITGKIEQPPPPPKPPAPGSSEEMVAQQNPEEKKDRPFILQGNILDPVKEVTYIAKKYASGLSFGLYDVDEEAPSDWTAVAGTLANIGGFLVSGFLTGGFIRGGLAATNLAKDAPAAAKVVHKVLSKGVPFLSKAIGKLEAGSQAAGASIKASKITGGGIKASTFAAKHGKALGAMALEAAPLGMAVGTTKGLIKGEDWKDSFAQGVVEGGLWTAGAAALYPVVAGAGALFGRREVSKLKKVYDLMGEDAVISKVKNMGVDDLLKTFEQVPEASRDANFMTSYRALQKIKATNPEGGIMSATDFAANPDITAEAVKQNMKKAVDGLYSGPTAPLGNLMAEVPTLQTMYKNGDYAGILSSTENLLREGVKQSSNLGDVATLPFRMDAAKSFDIIAGKTNRALEGKGIAGVDRGILTDFFKNPTAETLAPLKAAVPDAKALRQAIGVSPTSLIKGTKGITDIRISAQEAGDIANDYLATYFKTISTDGMIGIGDIGKLNETNAILKTATVMNKQFSNNMLQAYSRKVDQDLFEYVKPEYRDAVNTRIKIRATMIDSADDMAKIAEHKASIKSLGKDADPELVAEAQKNLKNAYASLARKNKNIRGYEAELAAFSPEDLSAVDDIVGKIYTPSKAELGLLSTDTNEYLRKFGHKDNPLYLKNGTDLADMMSMMIAAGKDAGYIKEPWLEDATKTVGTKYFASIQRKLRTQFGYNSAMEVLINRIKDNEIRVKQGKQYYMKGLEATGIARNTKAAKAAFKLAGNEITTSSPEFLALSPGSQKSAIAASKYVRGSYDELFTAINAERARMNLKPLSRRDNYITHIPKRKGFFATLTNKKSTPTKGEAPPVRGKAYDPRTKTVRDPSKPTLVHERPQTGGGEYYEDVVEAFEGYLEPALETIHNTSLVRELEDIRAFAPEKMGNIIEHIKDNIIVKGMNPLDKATDSVVRKGAEALMKRRAEGLILGNLNVIMQQATSAALSMAASPRDAMVATVKMFSKEYDELFKLSRNRQLAAPMEGVDMDKNLLRAAFGEGEGVMHSAKAAYNYYKKFLGYGFRKFDILARKHAFVTAAEYGKRQGILKLAASNGADPQKALLSYADEFADLIHGSFSKIDKPEALNSALGRALLQFQSFSMNLATTMMYDLPHMAYKEGAYKVSKNLLEAGAAMSIINEVLHEQGVPKPFDMAMAFPFLSTYRYGNSGLAQATYDFINYAGSDRTDKKGKAWRGIASAASAIAFPGSKQIYKATQAFGKITTKGGKVSIEKQKLKGGYNKGTAAAFGIYPQVQKMYEKRDEKKGFLRRAKSDVKRKLFK